MSLLKLSDNHYMVAKQVISVKLIDNWMIVETARGDTKLACENTSVWTDFIENLKENLTKPLEESMKKAKGFKANQEQIAKKNDVSKEAAAAILASATRKASPAAKKANPNLKKVK